MLLHFYRNVDYIRMPKCQIGQLILSLLIDIGVHTRTINHNSKWQNRN